MKNNFWCALVIVLVLNTMVMSGQNVSQAKVDTVKNVKFTPLPIVFFLPETGFGFGALGLLTFRSKGESIENRPSTVQLGLTYTTKKQILLFAPFELYAKEAQWRFVGELGYYKYFYNFYGIGDDSKKEDFEVYDATFGRVRFTAFREVFSDFSLGIGYEYDGYYNIKVAENGVLENLDTEGKEGGTLSNMGIVALYDTRDNIFNASKGFFVQGSLFTGVKALGSSFSYSKFDIDARYYLQLKGKHVLATNLFLGNSSSGTPFFDLNHLGTKRTRGHDNRRYQDNAELSLAMEYRFPIAGRVGGVLFGSSATVAPNLKTVFSTSHKPAFGAGLRYVVNKTEGTRIRVDYGRSNEGGNFYLTLKEAF